jgi:hypothetical protein
MFYYELHAHTNVSSLCSLVDPEAYIRFYLDKGFSGMVVTDHFYHGNTRPLRTLSWNDYVDEYVKGYEAAKKAAEGKDFDVFFGIEYNYGNAQEILIYGIDHDFLAGNPDMCDISVYELCDRVHKYGGFVSHAHPFRERGYIPKGNFLMDLSYVDAIEIYNSANREVEDEKAQALCRELNLAYTAGNDLHLDTHLKSFPNAGLEFDRRIRDNSDLVELLKSKSGRLKFSGERYFK